MFYFSLSISLFSTPSLAVSLSLACASENSLLTISASLVICLVCLFLGAHLVCDKRRLRYEYTLLRQKYLCCANKFFFAETCSIILFKNVRGNSVTFGENHTRVRRTCYNYARDDNAATAVKTLRRTFKGPIKKKKKKLYINP